MDTHVTSDEIMFARMVVPSIIININIVTIVSIVNDMFMMHGVIVMVHIVVSVVRSGGMSATIIVSINLIVNMAFNMSAFLAQRMV